MTQPMFYITSRKDSGIDLPNLDLTDEKLIGKYGTNLTANFADIRAYGSKAFFQKENLSDGITYSMCACATGYIWVYVSTTSDASDPFQFSNLEVQIGTFSLKSRAITTVEVPFLYKYASQDSSKLQNGQLSLLCATVLGNYLRLRTIGQQYEEAAETAIHTSRKELCSLRVVDPGRYHEFEKLLQQICTNAPLPPTSDVSLISRGMITGRWQCWRESAVLRRRYFFPKRIIQCFKASKHDSIDLLSGAFSAIAPKRSRLPILRPSNAGP